MIFVIIGTILVAVCVVIYMRTDMSILMRKDLIKPILLTISSFAGCMLILSPFLKFGIDITRLKKDTAYLQSEIITENTRRGNISEALVWEVTEHNDKVNCYFNNYDLWFGTPMFRHNTERYIINIDGYTVYKQEDDITTEEETVFDTVTEEETTAAE